MNEKGMMFEFYGIRNKTGNRETIHKSVKGINEAPLAESTEETAVSATETASVSSTEMVDIPASRTDAVSAAETASISTTETSSLFTTELFPVSFSESVAETMSETAPENASDTTTETSVEESSQKVKEVETAIVTTTETVPKKLDNPVNWNKVTIVTLAVSCLLFLAAAVAALLMRRHRKHKAGRSDKFLRKMDTRRSKLRKEIRKGEDSLLSYAQLNGLGKRKKQEDSMGVLELEGGLLAIVADGMGGLSDGDLVSQKIINTSLSLAEGKTASQLLDRLTALVKSVNGEVNNMLGTSQEVESGSTVLMVLAEQNCFRWLSVGDSRIYLYRGGAVLQINREHVFEAELQILAANDFVSFAEANTNPNRHKLTSFVGQGKIKYIDQSLHAVTTMPGDRILLLSDGVFNTLSDEEIANAVKNSQNPREALDVIDGMILQKDNPYQDNYTAVLLWYDEIPAGEAETEDQTA